MTLPENGRKLGRRSPGTYCGGLHLKANVLTFKPGTYVIKDGPLFIDDGSNIIAEDVTFVLSGKEATFQINFGAIAKLKAPAAGPLAGLVFFQDLSNPSTRSGVYPNSESVLQGGTQFSMIGTGYFPTQRVIFRRGNLAFGNAPATSFISYQMSIQDGGHVELDVDHQGAGLPPIVPRSDEGVRLVE